TVRRENRGGGFPVRPPRRGKRQSGRYAAFAVSGRQFRKTLDLFSLKEFLAVRHVPSLEENRRHAFLVLEEYEHVSIRGNAYVSAELTAPFPVAKLSRGEALKLLTNPHIPAANRFHKRAAQHNGAVRCESQRRSRMRWFRSTEGLDRLSRRAFPQANALIATQRCQLLPVRRKGNLHDF